MMIRPLVVALRDHGLDTVVAQPLADPGIAVPLVADEALRSHSRTTQGLGDGDLIHHRFDASGIVDLTRGHFDGDRKALAVSNHVEFAAESASRAAQSVVFRFVAMDAETFFAAPAADREARTLLPSIQNRSQSIRPSRSSRICSASKIRSNVSVDRHSLKFQYTVYQGPYRSGRSRQGAPVRRIQSTPLSISRALRRGRPVFAGFVVTGGSTMFHYSSVTSCRCAILRALSSYESYRLNGVFSNRA